MVLTGVALICGYQVPSSIATVCPVRRRNQIEELLYLGVDRDGNTPIWSCACAGRWVAGRGQQTSMGKHAGHDGDCSGGLYLSKALKVRKEERAITRQGPPEPGSELIANEWRNRIGAQIKIVLSVE